MSQIKLIDITGRKIPNLSLPLHTYVVFRNLDPVAHQINSGENENDFAFDVGILHPGEVSSPVCFSIASGPNGFSYGCGLHPGMAGKIYVDSPLPDHNDGHQHDHHDHDHLKHYHGFVTGGSSGEQLYMTHTPIFSDERHHFQIILEGQFAEQRHIEAYNSLRQSNYGQGLFQVFFDHLALVDIRTGKVKELVTEPERGARIYPEGVPTVIPELLGATIIITNVLHFRTFDPDVEYPEYLTYLMYGNDTDVFMDHFISRAPNFHSVARLATVPSFWTKEHYRSTLPLQITSKRMIDVSPKQIKRMAFVDNRFHLIWGAPSGSAKPQDPLGPLIPGQPKAFPVQLADGRTDEIQISHLLHFDANRLLNEGLGF